ncbi:MAG TPA: hypothetical protein VNP73_02410 [Actinomycetota bacterium]|nr:hypothetical protein [Actinomycetota bacterium]
MKIEDRRGEPVGEATVTVDDEELIDLLQGLADLVEGKREHVHVTESVVGGSHIVFRRGGDEEEAAPIERQMDWWVGPVVLFGALFLIIGLVTFVRWAVNLVT